MVFSVENKNRSAALGLDRNNHTPTRTDESEPDDQWRSMVELTGIEPVTLGLQSRCSPS